MEIRKTKPEELNILIRMYENARIFMASHGNPLQWGNTYPAPQILMDDISSGNSYVCVEHDKIIATFYYKEGIEMLFLAGEDFQNYHDILGEYRQTLAQKEQRIDDLYNEIKIIKKLKV